MHEQNKAEGNKSLVYCGVFFSPCGGKEKIKMEVHVGHVNTREDFISLSFEDPEKKLVGKELLRTL